MVTRLTKSTPILAMAEIMGVFPILPELLSRSAQQASKGFEMTDVNRSPHRIPKGRQTIRKGGSLSGFHGPLSRRIKLWTSDSKGNTTLAQLERVYFAALESVDRMEERSRINAASGKLTPEGMKADAQQFALNHLLPELHRSRELISRAKTALAERASERDLISGSAFKARHGAEIADTDELEEAIAAAESAVGAACEEIRVEAGS